ncbi:hypothetical protein [Intrasporangium sp. DVR]|uniref:hypothetical protein n=1 Tax=Intrasporangium sp. DVR TaxID=3127867 RepID=UPI00333F01D0
MMLGKKRMQRVTVGVLIGLVIVSLALTLVGGALAAAPGAGAARPQAGAWAVDEQATTPGLPGVVSSGDPRPVTETPQGTSTQVTDEEHIGGLLAYIAFMLGGVLLLVRARRRERRERAASQGSESILSAQ